MRNEQVSFFEAINNKDSRNMLIKDLRHYKALKVKLENQQESKDSGIVNLFPIIKNTDVISKIKVKQIERALDSSLDLIERKIIEQKYLNTEEIND